MAINIKLTNHVNWKKNNGPSGLFVIDMSQITPNAPTEYNTAAMRNSILKLYDISEDDFPTTMAALTDKNYEIKSNKQLIFKAYSAGNVVSTSNAAFDTSYNTSKKGYDLSSMNVLDLGAVVISFGTERDDEGINIPVYDIGDISVLIGGNPATITSYDYITIDEVE